MVIKMIPKGNCIETNLSQFPHDLYTNFHSEVIGNHESANTSIRNTISSSVHHEPSQWIISRAYNII